MARAGLGAAWACAFANDFEAKKAESYRANWGAGAFKLADVAALASGDLPGRADLLWASFPCQDLSLAGAGAGLAGRRSGTFWQVERLIRTLAAEGRAPGIVALENVLGLATSHKGADFAALVEALARLGYWVGALAIDAAHFTPQSRPRLFVVASRALHPPPHLTASDFDPAYSSPGLARALARLSEEALQRWVFWRLPAPPLRNRALIDLLEAAPKDAPEKPSAERAIWLAALSPASRRALVSALASKERRVGAAFRRTRRDADGKKIVRVEARFDGLAGCLRTPAGGSSRQSLLIVENGEMRLRAVSAREAARLMGLSDDYVLPKGATAAHHLLGDGVAAPVVRFLSENLLIPLAQASRK